MDIDGSSILVTGGAGLIGSSTIDQLLQRHDLMFYIEGGRSYSGEMKAPKTGLLHAAMQGDSMRFTRQDGVEEAWRVMAPLIDAPPPVHPYAKGTWGPAEADRLIAGHGRWHEPWTSS